jgi:hypothetical protein
VFLDVGEPTVEHPREPLGKWAGRRHVLGEPCEELVAVLGEKGHVERFLGGEVLVEQLLGHARGGGDLLQPRAGVAVLGEQGRGRLLDQLASLAFFQPSSGLALHKLPKSTLMC